MAIFRTIDSKGRSDRAAGDKQRHREKVREAIKERITDIIAEQSIIGKDKDRIIKVPVRGIKEYRFIYGDNKGGAGQGDGETKPGQVVGKKGKGLDKKGKGDEKGGDQPGEDYYETDVTLEELINIMFEDLELPNLERRGIRLIYSERKNKRKGYRKVGIQVRLDKKKTAKNRIRRKNAARRALREIGATVLEDMDSEEKRFPFHEDDLKYKHMDKNPKPESNAVVVCIMDTSGSMDTMKKYLARSFFFFLYQFILSKYRNVEIVFVAHQTEAKEVTEDEFFHKGESGGTFISSGYKKALEVIAARYDPSLWNIYAFHCSDGDNFESDNPEAIRTAKELTEICNLFGYGEIKPSGSRYYESSMIKLFKEKIKSPHFQTVLITSKDEVYPKFKEFMSKERKVE